MLAPREALFFRGSHGDAVHDDRSGWVVEHRIDAEHTH
jgi:hypothetical protein